ncbi:MAG: hypothetical protein ACOC1O_05735 [bacterium]
MKRNKSYDTKKSIKYYFLISHGFPFLITGLFMLIENSFYISNSFYGKLIYLGLLSPTFGAFFVLYYFSAQYLKN